MEDKIWYEFVHAKYGDCYLCLYLSFQKTIKKWVKIVTLLFSTGGIMGWGLWKGAPVVSCVLITIVQLFNLIQKHIILSDADINHISTLRELYYSHCNKLEELWVDYRADRLTDEQAAKRFFSLRKESVKIEHLDNKLDVRKRKRLQEKADLEVRNYINQYHS